MPNHIINVVTCDDMNELEKLLLDEKGEVDFNIVIPRPKDLDITSGSHSYDTPSKYFFAWRIPGTGEPGGLQSMGLQRVRHN